ncbi:MAG TPA: alpha/beta fold hydrolase [Anaeromyxobacteraceae bacterium]|nr:alpha/beta fold hydrolase [Anaeromyxobacteraceae bacterium]
MPQAGESRASAEPFDLSGGPDAALLLHGLTGSPFEVRFLAERLAPAGLRCRAPRLAGHPDPRALASTTWREWVAGARDELLQLARARRTFLVGCSMGALVACALACDHPDRVQALVLLAPALRLKPLGVLAGLLGQAPLSRLWPAIPKRAGSDVRDPEMRRLNPCMDSMPLGAVGELLRFQGEVDRRLPRVRAPALVLFGAHDHTVARSGAERLAARIGSGPARVVVLPESWHLVGIDVERERCAEEARRFLESIPA